MAEHPIRPAHRPGPTALLFVWTGGAVFVASLLVFLYMYGVVYGREVTASSWSAAAWDAVLFSSFALHHSLLARSGAKRLVTRFVPAWLERSLFTWVASLLFLLVCLAWKPVDGVLYSLSGTWRTIGFTVQAAGIALTQAGSSAIDMLDLAGIRPVLDARTGAVPKHVQLATGGVYGFARHPVYLGWTLVVFGAPHMTATRALFAVVSTLYLVIAIPLEERALVEVFGDRYRAYKKRTRWRMLPPIW